MTKLKMKAINRSALITENLGDRTFRLVKPFHYRVEVYGREDCFFIPKGFVSDLASVPQAFWSMGFSPNGPWVYAAIVHDWLCEYKGYIRVCKDGEPTEEVRRLESREAHKLFDRINKAEGVNWFVRKAMHRAVKWFGPRWKAEDRPYSIPLEIPVKGAPNS